MTYREIIVKSTFYGVVEIFGHLGNTFGGFAQAVFKGWLRKAKVVYFLL